ncbi:MAG TPA: hypothetical protein VMW66_00175, partial [Elusimicrobiales bacterium]|nr:hypothetical protein [Elusimicrobiales bacterium]
MKIKTCILSFIISIFTVSGIFAEDKNVNEVDINLQTKFFEAIKNRDAVNVKKLLKNPRLNVNYDYGYLAPKNYKAIHYLLDPSKDPKTIIGADNSIVKEWEDNLPEFVKAFIDRGANVNVVAERVDTPLHLLMLRLNTPVVKEVMNILVKKGGADVNIIGKRLAPAIFYVFRPSGRTKKDTDLLYKQMIDYGAKTDMTAINGCTLADVTAHLGYYDYFMQFNNLLIENDNLREIPFLVAQGSNNLCVSSLGQAPYNCDTVANEEIREKELAIKIEGWKKILNWFKENSGDINALDPYGLTAMSYASPEIRKFFIEMMDAKEG